MKMPLRAYRSRAMLLLALLIVPADLHAAPPIELHPLNFGIVKHESKLSHQVTLTNTAAHAIRILQVRATCPEWTKVDLKPQELPAGESVTFTVRMEPPKDYPEGPVASRILIVTDDPDQPHRLIRVRAYITKTAASNPQGNRK